MSCEGWRTVRLADVIDFDPSERISKGSLAKKVAMEKLQPFNRYIRGYGLAEYNGGSKFRNGDTLFARITPCLENGKTSQVTILNNAEVGFGSTEFIVLRGIPDLSDNNFIYYLALSPEFREIAIKSMVGTTGRQRVQRDVLEKITMSFPPLSDQKSIAATLSCLDDKIELNNRINKNLEEIAQAIFKSWFVDFEPFQDGEFVDSKLGQVPKGWRVLKAQDVFDISIGKTPPRKESQWFTKNMNDIKWASISDMGKSGVYILDTSEFLTKEAIKKFNVTIAPENTVLLSFKLTIGRISITNEPMATNEAIAHFKTSKTSLLEYLYYSLKKFNYFSLGNTSSIATAVNSKIIKSMQLCIPSDKIINEFHKLTTPLFSKIRANQRENKILLKLRDELLAKLMSGEIRIPVEM